MPEQLRFSPGQLGCVDHHSAQHRTTYDTTAVNPCSPEPSVGCLPTVLGRFGKNWPFNLWHEVDAMALREGLRSCKAVTLQQRGAIARSDQRCAGKPLV